jgi:hypothetical protein
MTGGAAALRRRRLTLAPRKAPAPTDVVSPLSGKDGSRFHALVSESSASGSKKEGIPFWFAQQVLEGEEDDGWTPVSRRKRGSS